MRRASGNSTATPDAPPVVIQENFVGRCRRVAVGIVHDLRNWDRVPGKTAPDKCKRVAAGRFEYIMGFLLLIVAIVAIAKCCSR